MSLVSQISTLATRIGVEMKKKATAVALNALTLNAILSDRTTDQSVAGSFKSANILESKRYYLGFDLGLYGIADGPSVVQAYWGIQLDGFTQSAPQNYTPASIGLGRSAYHVNLPMRNVNAAGLSVITQSAAGTNNAFEVTSYANRNSSANRGDLFKIGTNGEVLILNRDLLAEIDARIKTAEIVDNLVSTAANLPLSANQGRILDQKIIQYTTDGSIFISPENEIRSNVSEFEWSIFIANGDPMEITAPFAEVTKWKHIYKNGQRFDRSQYDIILPNKIILKDESSPLYGDYFVFIVEHYIINPNGQ